jgi:DNA-binding CsgD family transcriptional regulator
MLANAEQLALSLNDKSYLSKVYSAKVEMYKSQNDFENALTYQEKLNTLNDSLARGEREKIVRQLEVQFEVSEMNRQLKLTLQEHKITKLTNYLLWGALAVLLFIGGGIFVITRKMNRRDKQLLETKVALMQAKEEQKKLKEAQMQHEIEFKESQLSAMALQMMQKNDLLKELEEKLGQDTDNQPNTEMRKIISRGWNHDSDWNDFNTVFEGINHNFYARLKAAYPEISPNDLRLCALIKLNMSIKEMAGILNISPDSVKTARYRLRKKLQLNTEDNLTDFIISL